MGWDTIHLLPKVPVPHVVWRVTQYFSRACAFWYSSATALAQHREDEPRMLAQTGLLDAQPSSCTSALPSLPCPCGRIRRPLVVFTPTSWGENLQYKLYAHSSCSIGLGHVKHVRVCGSRSAASCALPLLLTTLLEQHAVTSGTCLLKRDNGIDYPVFSMQSLACADSHSPLH